MPSDNRKSVIRAMEDKAEICTSAELKVLFQDFGHDPDMLAAMQRGVNKDYASQDRGNYLEDSSPGYNNAWRKKSLMKDFQLAAYKASAGKEPATAVKKDSSTELVDLLKAVKDIQARLDRIESQQGMKPKP